MKMKVISIILLGMLVIQPCLVSYAEPTDEEKEKIEENTGKLSEAEKELQEVEEKLSKVSADIDLAQAEIESNKGKLDETEKNIKSAEIEIDALKDDIDKKEVVLGERLNVIYKAGGTDSYLQMLLSSESITDFIGRVGAVNKILDLDKSALEDVTSKKEQLERKVEKLSKDKEDIKTLTENNNEKVEEEKAKKEELDSLYEEYEGKLKSADIDLATSEKALYKYWSDIIKNSNSDKSDLENAIKSLKDIKEQLKSNAAKEDVDSLIENANGKIKEKNVVISKPSVSRGIATGKAGDIIAYGTGFIGCAYRMGATGPNVFDCSGFMQYIFGNYNISLLRTTYSQMTQGVAVNRESLQPGDLIFTESGGHVGVYIGNNQMLHAANSKQGVIVGPIYHYYSARRVL